MMTHTTAAVGNLPDGTYSVVWSFTRPHGQTNYPPIPDPVTGQFYVFNGQVAAVEVPAMSPVTLLLLALVLIGAGWRALLH